MPCYDNALGHAINMSQSNHPVPYTREHRSLIDGRSATQGRLPTTPPSCPPGWVARPFPPLPWPRQPSSSPPPHGA